MEGNPRDLSASAAEGKAVVLVFWQTWCRSCEREAPGIAAAAKAQAEAAEFYGVVAGPNEFVNDDEVGRTARKWGYVFPQIRDRDLRLTQEFHISATPTIVVLTPGGDVSYRGRRPPEDWGAVTRPSAP
jgi:thiol-disulfide isomerase/thioredoxin